HLFLPFLSTHTSPPAMYTLSLHDALPISAVAIWWGHDVSRRRSPNSIGVKSRCPASMRVNGIVVSCCAHVGMLRRSIPDTASRLDRKSTRLNSSHDQISYAVFCLKKKKQK